MLVMYIGALGMSPSNRFNTINKQIAANLDKSIVHKEIDDLKDHKFIKFMKHFFVGEENSILIPHKLFVPANYSTSSFRNVWQNNFPRIIIIQVDAPFTEIGRYIILSLISISILILFSCMFSFSLQCLQRKSQRSNFRLL